jgi:DNA-binding response OmpR family regulator
MATKTILIVDDDLAFAQLLEDGLTGAGYETCRAKHGAMAFADLQITRPALMLVDVFLPVIAGSTFCRMARVNPSTRTTPIIVISAMPNLQATISIPVAGFLAKPLDIDVLLRRVASLVDVPVIEKQASA